MGKIYFCNRESKQFLEGPCQYERIYNLKDDPNCLKCPYYLQEIRQKKSKPKREEQVTKEKPKQIIWSVGDWKKFEKFAKKALKTNSIPNYEIDQRLIGGIDFSEGLLYLVGIFNTLPLIRIEVKAWEDSDPIFPLPKASAQTKETLREMNFLEKTFRDYFLQPFSKSGMPLSSEVAKRCIARVNRKLKHFYPCLNPSGPKGKWGYSLAQFIEDPYILYWKSLAEVISDRKTWELIHKCNYCGKIFFSRKWVDYHPGCEENFSEKKRVREGRAKLAMKKYREKKRNAVKVT